jgi:SAM-dependent methyltransferase
MADRPEPRGPLARDAERAFGAADPAHFRFQTEAPLIAERERDLVRRAFLPLGERVLDVGSGQGATLVHLGAVGAVGIDLFREKVHFAREAVPSCRFEEGSAYAIPFPDGAFDHVLVRDVIHHLDEPERCLAECARVLAPGGRLDVLEPCRYNPLIALHALTTPEERGELRSTVPFLTGLAAAHFRVTAVERLQAFPIHRVVLHPKVGVPRLAQSARVRWLLGAVEGLAEKLVPEALWAYIHVRAERR